MSDPNIQPVQELLSQIPGAPRMPVRQPIVQVAVADVESKVASDLGLLNLDDPQTSAMALVKAPVVQQAVDHYFDQLTSIDMMKGDQVTAAAEMARNMGLQTQEASAMRNDVMSRQIKQLGAAEGGNRELRADLAELLKVSNQLDPSGYSFTWNGLMKLIGWALPDRVQAYFLQFEKGSTVIDQLLKNLDAGAARLKRNNVTIQQEQTEIRQLTVRLLHVAAMGMALQERLEAKIAELPEGSELQKFMKQEVLFTLQTRVKSILKQLTVNQQGYMAMEMARRVNEQLYQAVLDTRNVTVSALNIAIFLAFIVHDQKLTLDVIEALDAKANELIQANAKMLRQNLIGTMKRIVDGGLQFEAIKAAMDEVKGAISDYDRLREEALAPQKQQLTQLMGLAEDAEKSIQRLERGNVAKERMMDLTADLRAA